LYNGVNQYNINGYKYLFIDFLVQIAANFNNRVAKKSNKKQSKKILIVLIILFIIGVTAIALLYNQRSKFVRYSAFGIDLPVNYSIHGIDISKHQSVIDWEDVSKMKIKNIKIDFAFIKATEGVSLQDEKFEKNWTGAKNNNIIRGAYHFFIPTRSGKMQAQNFINTVQLKKNDLPPVIDVEQTNGVSTAILQQQINEWLKLVTATYHVKPIIYTNADFYENYLAGQFDGYPIWIAHYLTKNKPRINTKWLFWQHSESGHVNGIDAYVDFNVFNGDSAAFRDLLLK
jgi:lysozyme